MAQHKASRKRTFRSAMKHKKAADLVVDSLETLVSNISTARAKVSADTNTLWDTDYEATAGVSEVDFDEPSIGQHKAKPRKIIVKTLAHNRMGNEISDIIEEAQVTLNLVLAQMDADAGTLSVDSVYEAFRIADVLDPDDDTFSGQHKQSMRRTARGAISHKSEGDWLVDSMRSVQTEINAMIDDIQAAN